MNQRTRGPLSEPAVGARAPAAALALEKAVGELELQLTGVRQALKNGGSPEALDHAIEQLMAGVTRSRQLTLALDQRHAHQVAPFRDRLRLALAELQAQREAIARSSAALERAAEILVPADASSYDAQGHGAHTRLPGGVTA